MGVEPDKVNASLTALSDAVYKNGMIVDGLGKITTDELHAYEEGLNSNAERLYLNWGEPRAVERLMDTVRGLQRVLLVNAQGHMHFVSNWYGGRKIYREGAWEWQKPYSFTVMHAPMLVGLYNGNPAARGLVTGVIDGWLAHGKQGADGSWSFPNEINWRTDAERAGDGGGLTTPLQASWAAYRFTGDAKYLRPIEARVARAGPAALGEFNDNVFAIAPMGETWRKALLAKPGDSDFARYTEWGSGGDVSLLADIQAGSIATKTQRLYMMTEGHWWTDRVESDMAILQRERLGGVALARNQTWPGNIVSWRFTETDAGEQVAILLPDARPDHFRVIAYNTTDRPQRATMTGWGVTAGQWSMTYATSNDGGATLNTDSGGAIVTLERSGSVEVSFAPHTTTVYDFTLTKAGTPVAERPDLGIGRDDVTVKGRSVAVTVHSLGSVATAGGSATLVDTDGKVLATVAIPALKAPLDLLPKTAMIRLTLPAGIDPKRVSVRVALPGDAAEVTRLNNIVPLAAASG
jgi:hypothetical protein